MRRPLTPNGVPFVQSGAVAPGDTIFDVNDLDPSYVWAVTLYCWAPVVSGEIAAIVSAGIASDGNPVVPVAFLNVGTNFENYRIYGNGPAKVMDRIPMRGNQQLIVAKTSDNSSVYWFGYYEPVGVGPVPASFRPLLPDGPSGLASPYNAPVPFIVVAPGGGTQSENVHRLDSQEQRIDYLWLDISGSVDNVGADGSPIIRLNLPGGVSMPIFDPVPNDPADQAGSPIRIFDGIPFRAPASGDNLIQLQADGTAAVGTVTAVASGRFIRQ